MKPHEQLKLARVKLGLSRAQMARELATPYVTYYSWESGNNPRRVPGIALKCAELLLIHKRVPAVFKKVK